MRSDPQWSMPASLFSQLLPFLFHRLFCPTELRTIPLSGPICKQPSSPSSIHLFHPSFLQLSVSTTSSYSSLSPCQTSASPPPPFPPTPFFLSPRTCSKREREKAPARIDGHPYLLLLIRSLPQAGTDFPLQKAGGRCCVRSAALRIPLPSAG